HNFIPHSNACGVNDDVDAPVCLHRLLEKAIHLCAIGDIGLDKEDVVAAAPHFFFDTAAPLIVDINEHTPGPALRKGGEDRPADARGGTRHYRDLSVELSGCHHTPPSMLLSMLAPLFPETKRRIEPVPQEITKDVHREDRGENSNAGQC